MRNLGRSVLSDLLRVETWRSSVVRLNAPFGARCFLMSKTGMHNPLARRVLMHCLALGAF